MKNKIEIEIELKKLILKLIKAAMADISINDFSNMISINPRNLYAYNNQKQIPLASNFFDILKLENRSAFDKKDNYSRIKDMFTQLYEAMRDNLTQKRFLYKEVQSQMRDLFPDSRYNIKWAEKLSRFSKGKAYKGENENVRISTLDMLKLMYCLIYIRKGDVSCLTFSDDPIVIYLMNNVYFVYLKIIDSIAGGKALDKKLTFSERSDIAIKAANTRWKNKS